MVRGKDSQRPQPVGDVGQRDRLELTAPADGFLVEGDGLLGCLPGAGELVKASLAVEVLHRGHSAGIDIRVQVPPCHQLFQGLGELLIGIDSQFSCNVLRSQMDDEALLRSREGTQQAPVKVSVRDAQVRERLRLALAMRQRRGSDYHRYILLHATDRKDAARRPSP
jgi:hypothetical protein